MFIEDDVPRNDHFVKLSIIDFVRLTLRSVYPIIKAGLVRASSFLSFRVGITYQHCAPNTLRWDKSGEDPYHRWYGGLSAGSDRDVTRLSTYVAVESASAQKCLGIDLW